MNWLLLNSGKCGAAFNMALDEALLEAVSRLGKPVLRFYGWTEPAATFGYFQKYADVERATLLRPLIRRPTGGGIVPHAADWTYSAVFPPGHEWHSVKAEESYRRIHDWLRLAFAELEVKTELAPCCKKIHSGTVFRRTRKIRPALARQENRRRGAAAEQAGVVDPGFCAAAAGKAGAGGLAERDARRGGRKFFREVE